MNMTKVEGFELIKTLTELQGVSGNEGRVRQFIQSQLALSTTEVQVDGLGYVFGEKKSAQSDAPKLMIAAHMDEVGFMVKDIKEFGLISVIALGGWNPYAVSAQRFTLQTQKGDYVCVSSAVAPHLLRGADGSNKTVKVEDILFDAGFTSKEEALKYGVRPGDSIVPQTETVWTANKKAIISKAWDNRYGCAVMLETMHAVKDEALNAHIIAGASVQEEVGLRGIPGAVRKYQPDAFIAVDCSPAGDATGDKNADGQLGNGFLLRMQDPRMITHKGMIEFLEDMALTHHIPYQYYFSKGGTDAVAAHTLNHGIPSAVVGVAARYIHGHQTLFHISDYDAAKEMMIQVVRNFDRTTLNTIHDMM